MAFKRHTAHYFYHHKHANNFKLNVMSCGTWFWHFWSRTFAACYSGLSSGHKIYNANTRYCERLEIPYWSMIYYLTLKKLSQFFPHQIFWWIPNYRHAVFGMVWKINFRSVNKPHMYIRVVQQELSYDLTNHSWCRFAMPCFAIEDCKGWV